MDKLDLLSKILFVVVILLLAALHHYYTKYQSSLAMIQKLTASPL